MTNEIIKDKHVEITKDQKINWSALGDVEAKDALIFSELLKKKATKIIQAEAVSDRISGEHLQDFLTQLDNDIHNLSGDFSAEDVIEVFEEACQKLRDKIEILQEKIDDDFGKTLSKWTEADRIVKEHKEDF